MMYNSGKFWINKDEGRTFYLPIINDTVEELGIQKIDSNSVNEITVSDLSNNLEAGYYELSLTYEDIDLN